MKRKLISLTFLLAAALSGCVVAPPMYRPAPSGTYFNAPHAGGVVVSPGAGYFWIDGLWLLNGGRRVWQPGRWESQHHGNAREPQHHSGGNWRR